MPDDPHVIRITEIQTYEEALPPYAYRAKCSCGWVGWQVFSRADAWAAHDAHLRTDTGYVPAGQSTGDDPDVR